MSFLSDGELIAKIDCDQSLAPDCKSSEDGNRNAQVKAGSLDLTIGEIYIPGTKSGKPGAHNKPRKKFSLGQGETAIVRTSESVCLPSNLGGIAFPPASLSLTGLLTTNPGHLDPGYDGKLHLTLINMSSTPIQLEVGLRIVRVLFYEMRKNAVEPYVIKSGSSPIGEELLDSLSRDFLNVSGRAKTAAKEAVAKSQFFQSYGVPILAALLAATAAHFSAYLTQDEEYEKEVDALQTRIDRLEGRIGGLGGDVNLDAVEQRIGELEEKVE